MKNNIIQLVESQIQKQKELVELEEFRLHIIKTKLDSIDENVMKKAFEKIGVIQQDKEPYCSFIEVIDFMKNIRSKDELLQSSLIIEFRLEATTLKPMYSDLYSKGDSIRATNKAKKLEEKLRKLTGFRCDINKYSLVSKDVNTKITPMIKFFI